MQNIRHISLFGMLLTRDETEFSNDYLNGKADEELEKSLLLFEDWWKGIVEKRLTRDEQNEGHGLIFGVCTAYENHAREDGIRTGLRMMHEALSDFPSIKEIEKKEREKKKAGATNYE